MSNQTTSAGQHPRAAERGISPWRYEMDGNYMRLYTGCPVLTGDVARGYVGELAASVICDALNTMNAVGKMPSELAAENAALRDAVRELRDALSSIASRHPGYGGSGDIARHSLTKTENLT